MIHGRFAPAALIITIASVLVALLGQYWFRQQALLLEGSHLYTRNAALLKGDSSALLENLDKLGEDARVFNELDGSENMRVVAASDMTRLPFPVHGGTGLTNSHAREALVGSSVETQQANGEWYVTIDGERYKVVGLLGARDGGALQNDIVLKDDGLFGTPAARSIILDGSEAAARYREIDPGATLEAFDYGIARRTTVDTITPVLLGVGYLVASLSYLFAGWLYGIRSVEQCRVIDILGFSRRVFVARQLAAVACAVGISFAGAHFLVANARTSLFLPVSIPVLGLVAFCLSELATAVPLVASRRTHA